MDTSQYIKPREYEMMTILLPDQAEGDTEAGIQKVLSYITDEQGTIDSVSNESPWGRRRLAYTIRHEGVDYRDGHYVLVYFTALPSAIGEIERELKLDTNVIRYLLLTHDPQMGEKFDESQVEESDEETETGMDETEIADADKGAERTEESEAGDSDAATDDAAAAAEGESEAEGDGDTDEAAATDSVDLPETDE